MRSVELAIEGMHCGACASRVRTALEEVAGVRSAEVSLEDGEARVEAEEGTPSDALVAAVERAGYGARPRG